MESLVVNYGVEIAVYSKKTNKFMRYDPESRKVKADSIHPFLKVEPWFIRQTAERKEASVLKSLRSTMKKTPVLEVKSSMALKYTSSISKLASLGTDSTLWLTIKESRPA